MDRNTLRKQQRLNDIVREARRKLVRGQQIAANAIGNARSAENIAKDMLALREQFDISKQGYGSMLGAIGNAFGNTNENTTDTMDDLRHEMALEHGLPLPSTTRPSRTVATMPSGTGLSTLPIVRPTGRHTARIAPAPTGPPAPAPAPKPKGWRNKLANFGKSIFTRRAPVKSFLNVMEELTREQDKLDKEIHTILSQMRIVDRTHNTKINEVYTKNMSLEEKKQELEKIVKAKNKEIAPLQKEYDNLNKKLNQVLIALDRLMNNVSKGGRRVTQKRRR